MVIIELLQYMNIFSVRARVCVPRVEVAPEQNPLYTCQYLDCSINEITYLRKYELIS